MSAESIDRVALIVAMRAEARHVLDAVGATRRAPVASDIGTELPFQWHDARVGGIELLIAVNGKDERHGCDNIGTLPATLNSYLAINDHRPDLVITAGTAGGFERHGAEIGDVFLSEERFVFHDRRIPHDELEAYGIGSHPALAAGSLAAELGFKTGIVSTSDSLDESEPDRLAMIATGAQVKEMEAAGIAWICETLGVPLLAVKTITDLVDHPADTVEQFVENLGAATHRLAASVPAVLRAIDGRSLASLA